MMHQDYWIADRVTETRSQIEVEYLNGCLDAPGTRVLLIRLIDRASIGCVDELKIRRLTYS